MMVAFTAGETIDNAPEACIKISQGELGPHNRMPRGEKLFFRIIHGIFIILNDVHRSI
jgi:hypothetical protein